MELNFYQILMLCMVVALPFILLLMNNTKIKNIGDVFKEVGEIKEKINNIIETIKETPKNFIKDIFQTPQSAGQWGEIQLQRVLEIAGMQENIDYFINEKYQNENIADKKGNKEHKPDVVVKLPGNRVIFIDAKTPTLKDGEKISAKNMRTTINDLSNKQYWNNTDSSIDFVVMFLPAEGMLQALMEQDNDIVSDACSKDIIIATPITLLGILRAVAYTWKQNALAENMKEIWQICGKLIQINTHITDKMNKLKKSLDNSVKSYDDLDKFVKDKVVFHINEIDEKLKSK